MDKSSFEIKLKDLNIWVDVDIVGVDSIDESFVVKYGNMYIHSYIDLKTSRPSR
jgi:hypothetical protein